MAKNSVIGGKKINIARIVVVMAIVILAAVAGAFVVKPANAISGDPANWTVTKGGLTVTIVSVQQYGEEIEPVWSNTLYNEQTKSFGAYYFPTVNNSDTVRLGVRVDGMQEGEQYKLFYTQTVTSADNGQTFYKDATPSAIMEDSYYCVPIQDGQRCSSTPMANEYTLEASLHEDGDWGDFPRFRVVFRPQSVGSSNVEITSVKQGNEDVVLDLTGRTTASVETTHTINEYQLEHYNQPVTISYRLKNLVVGNHYSLNVGNGSYTSFTATDTVMTGSKTVTLDLVKKHTDIGISLYGQSAGESEYVRMYFVVTDPNFRPLGSLIIDDINQGNRVLTGTPLWQGSPTTYSFEANDVEDLEVYLHAMDVTRDMDYYLTFQFNSQGSGGSYYAPKTERVSGEELWMGACVTVPALYGETDNSLFTLSIYASATDSGGYSNTKVFYHDYVEDVNYGDTLQVTFVEDENIPRYSGSLSYTNPEATEPEIFEGVINAKYHNADNPLKMRIEGEHYNPTQNYNIAASVTKGEENVRNFLFTATGAELNAGKDFILENLVLSLPTFDPEGSLSMYDSSYTFTVEINGLTQTGYFYYTHNGWASSVMTYAGGKVATIDGVDGVGAAGVGIVVNGATVRRSSLDGTKNAMIHYIGEGFDDEASYGYRLFYNSNSSNSWSETAGQMIENGVMPGSALNAGELSINVRVPEDGMNGAMYTMVIERDGGMVILVRNYLTLTDDPMIESFALNANSDSFMQTSAFAYRMAEGTDATATLTGAGFENAEQYKLWINYNGFRYIESEYGSYGSYEDMPDLNEAIVLTGAQLNAGYVYALNYDEVFAGKDFINVSFRLTDLDATNPFNQVGMGEMGTLNATGGEEYLGHSISIEYVPAEEVFNEHGYQIDAETSAIIDVSQPVEPGEIIIHNETKNESSVEEEDGLLTVISQRPVIVIGVKNGVYSRVDMGSYEDVGGGTRNCSYDVSNYSEVYVVLKANLYDNDKVIDLLDANVIYRALINRDSVAYRALSSLERITADLNNDNVIDLLDANVIYRSLLNHDSLAYQEISW